MNNMIKYTLVFAAGVGVGAGTTYLYIKDKFEKIANEEIASVRDNAARERIINVVTPSIREGNVNEDIKRRINLVDMHREISRKYGGDSIPDNAAVDPAELEYPREEEEEYHDSERKTMNANKSDYPDPYIISLEEFTEGEEHYDKVTLYFYDVDEALAEEDETLIDDPEAIVGANNLTAFGDMSDGDPDTIYVRNERFAIDYEIIRLPKSYVEMTLTHGR